MNDTQDWRRKWKRYDDQLKTKITRETKDLVVIETFTVCVVGTGPLVYNAMPERTILELLGPRAAARFMKHRGDPPSPAQRHELLYPKLRCCQRIGR